MNIQEIQKLWESALREVLDFKMDQATLTALSFQMHDSIRRVEIYTTYKERAEIADEKGLPYYFNTNPLVLSQRPSISKLSKLWFLYLATYFGKSLSSKWLLFKRAAFRNGEEIIFVEEILEEKGLYFKELQNLDFFSDCQFSNHRKYTKKSLYGSNGFIYSANYFLDNIDNFNFSSPTDFDSAYSSALEIPLFGRMAAFDYICSLSKCNLNVEEPNSMYLKHSTGPQVGIKYLLTVCGIDSPEIDDIIQTGNELQQWFQENTGLFLVAQILEDAICNWQKNPNSQVRYFG